MSFTRRTRRLAALALSVSMASALPEKLSPRTAAPITSASAASSTSAAADALTTAVIPVYLWSIADSLFHEYFSTSTPLALSDVKFPATVVIGSVTYNMQTTSAASTTSNPTSAATSDADKGPSHNHQKGDKSLGIILGVVIGAVALAVMVIVFCCLRHRKEKTGSFFMRRRTPSVASTNDSRRPIGFGTTHGLGNSTQVVGGPDASRNAPVAMAMHPAAMHPAYSTNHSSRSTSDSRPFVTAFEDQNGHNGHHELDSRDIEKPSELDHVEPSHRRSTSSVRDARPQTPLDWMATGPAQQQEKKRPVPPQLQTQQPTNPFSSPEDREAEDLVSPIVPQKSWERRNSPLVHYPSMSEVTSFDFSDDDRPQNYDGGDGFRPPRNIGGARHQMS